MSLLIGSKVTAGTVNCDGQVTVRAEHSGQQTVIADIVRMVEVAQVRLGPCAHAVEWKISSLPATCSPEHLTFIVQARTAPIQRTADAVAGKFAYGVITLSAATFAFWALVGTRAFPQVQIPSAVSMGVE